jgi:hypothetical protein
MAFHNKKGKLAFRTLYNTVFYTIDLTWSCWVGIFRSTVWLMSFHQVKEPNITVPHEAISLRSIGAAPLSRDFLTSHQLPADCLCHFWRVLNESSSFILFEMEYSVQEHIFWDITLCSPLKVIQRFGATYRFHLQFGISRAVICVKAGGKSRGILFDLFDAEGRCYLFLRNVGWLSADYTA